MKPRTEEDLMWLGTDLDKTIADNTGHPEYLLTKPMPGAREALIKLESRGFKIIIYTARPWNDYEKIENFMLYHDLPFRRIICGKPLFFRVIDDRNIEFDGDWDKVLKKLDILEKELEK